MPALYPHSAKPEDFTVGDSVRWYVNEQAISPYVGRVTHIAPSTYKVWVQWPVGDNQQHDPYELILVPKEQGISPIHEVHDYSSYEKAQSEKYFGNLPPKVVKKLASQVACMHWNDKMGHVLRKKAASKIASDYQANVLDAIIKEAAELKESGSSDLQAYGALYTKYASEVSDDFIRERIFEAYGDTE